MPLPRFVKPRRAKEVTNLRTREVSAGSLRLRTATKELIATRLCALVYRQGKTKGRFEMSLDQLLKESAQKKGAIEVSLLLAEDCDWIRRDGSAVVLKAAGIHVAKCVLGL